MPQAKTTAKTKYPKIKKSQPRSQKIIKNKTNKTTGAYKKNPTEQSIYQLKYQAEANQLDKLGFDKLQIKRLLNNTDNEQSIAFFMHSVEWLLARFSYDEIVKIYNHIGGMSNIQIIKSAYNKLIQLGFTSEEIANIVGYNYGANNILAILGFYQELAVWGFSHKQIISMVNQANGDKAIEAVYLAYAQLNKIFNNEQITTIASLNYAEKHLELLKNNLVALCNDGLTAKQIIDFILDNQQSNPVDKIYEKLNKYNNNMLLNDLGNEIFINDDVDEQLFSKLSLETQGKHQPNDVLSTPSRKTTHQKFQNYSTPPSLIFYPQLNNVSPKRQRRSEDAETNAHKLPQLRKIQLS